MKMTTRRQWGAASPTQVVPHTRSDFVVVHWSVTDESASIRGIQQGHFNRGFFDIAYNHLIRGSTGEFIEGRGWRTRGGATGKGVDAYTTSVCVVEDDPHTSDEAYRTLARYIYEHNKMWFTKHEASVHRNHYPTACPGDSIAMYVNSGQYALVQIAMAQQFWVNVKRLTTLRWWWAVQRYITAVEAQ